KLLSVIRTQKKQVFMYCAAIQEDLIEIQKSLGKRNLSSAPQTEMHGDRNVYSHSYDGYGEKEQEHQGCWRIGVSTVIEIRKRAIPFTETRRYEHDRFYHIG